VAGSTTKAPLRLPSWIAFDQCYTPAQFTPARSTAPHLPPRMWRPTEARQLPSLELGNPPKLQPQPKSQLQNSYPWPVSVHVVFVAVAMAAPPRGRGHPDCRPTPGGT